MSFNCQDVSSELMVFDGEKPSKKKNIEMDGNKNIGSLSSIRYLEGGR